MFISAQAGHCWITTMSAVGLPPIRPGQGDVMHPEALHARATDASERDDVAAAALTVVRRACVEGVPVTRELFAREVSVALETTAPEAMARVDAVAQRLGVSSLD